jgi:hypothetical protein
MKLTAGELRKELAPARASASARSVAEIFNAPSSSAAPGGHCGQMAQILDDIAATDRKLAARK